VAVAGRDDLSVRYLAYYRVPGGRIVHYAQGVKRRKGGRVVEGTTKIICGSEAAVPAR
jgi:hypothetical protein